MANKQKALLELLGISDGIDLNKEKLIIYLEEGDTQEEFTVRLFDVSKGEQPTLIKEIGYGMLSYLHDEDVIDGLKEAGKYSFNVQQQNISYSDNVVEFKKSH